MSSIGRLATLAIFAGTAVPASAVTLPDFSAATFIPGTVIDNPYLPWIEGARSAQVGSAVEDGEAVVERDQQDVLGKGPKILGVRTTAVVDRGFEDGVLTERTRDYYAQDTDGNVWYMGEDSVAYEYDDDGKLIGKSTEGSWRAGRHHAQPGYAMPAGLELGFGYYQEFAPKDEALDKARTYGLLDALEVGGKTYSKVLQVLETSGIELDAREFKYYAPGVGLIRAEEDLDPSLANPRITLDRVKVAPVPLPPALGLLGLGLAMLAGVRGTRRRRQI